MYRNERRTMYAACRMLAYVVSLCALVLAPLLGYAQSPEAHKATVQAFNDAVNDRAFERFDALVKADFVRHSPATPGVQVRSRQDFIAYLQSNHVIFPDERVEMHRLVAEGDYVGFWATYHGTQQQPMPTPTGTLPATGQTVAMPFSGVFRLEDGQIAELWVTWDNLGILAQLGHFPPGDASTEDEASGRDPGDRKALISRIADDIWNQGDLAVIDEVMAPDAMYHGPHMPGGIGDRESWRRAISGYRSAFPDAHVTYEEIIVSGDTVVGRWSGTGTHRGPLPGVAPTGKEIAISGTTIYRIADGRIVEAWEQLNLLGMWQQLGVFSPPGHAPPSGDPTDPEAARAALLAADRAWANAAEAGDVEQVLTYWADDVVVYLERGQVVRGHDAMEAVVRQNRARPGFSMAREVTGGEVAASGDLGYTTGTFEMTMPRPEGDPVVRSGHYVCVWEKQADGAWKTIVQASNTRGDASAAAN